MNNYETCRVYCAMSYSILKSNAQAISFESTHSKFLEIRTGTSRKDFVTGFSVTCHGVCTIS